MGTRRKQKKDSETEKEVQRTLDGISDRYKKLEEQASAMEKLESFVSYLEDLSDGSVIQDVPVKWIKEVSNIREFGTEGDDFEQLKISISKDGLLQPISVTTHKARIQCVDGHRRLAAIKEIGIEKVNVLYKKTQSYQEVELIQAMSNLARKDMTLIEEADILLRFEDMGMQIQEISKRVKMDRKKVSKMLMISKWPEAAKKLVKANPKKLVFSKLAKIAKAETQEDEVMSSLRQILSPEKKSDVVPKSPSFNRVASYLQEKKFKTEDKRILLRGLVDLGFIKSEERTQIESEIS